MLRLLIEDVTLIRDRTIQLHIRWNGGATTSLERSIPRGAPDLRRTPAASAYSGHRDHSVRAIVITRSDHRDRSSERSDARAIVSSLVLSSQVIWALQGDIRVAAPLANVACSASWRSPDRALGHS